MSASIVSPVYAPVYVRSLPVDLLRGPPVTWFPARTPGHEGEPVELRRAGGRAWVVGPASSDPVLAPSGRRAVPLDEYAVRQWGRRARVQCHTSDPGHPWNPKGCDPGYEDCGLCGYPTWIEAHGYADGQCERCGYSG